MAKRIFISFDHDNDANYKNLLLAWNAHGDFDLEFYNHSVNEKINSENSSYVKSRIKEKLSRAGHLLCLVGKHTHKSEWVDWEIGTAANLGKKIIAVKIDKSNISPNALLAKGATWAMSFTFEAIKKAINSA